MGVGWGRGSQGFSQHIWPTPSYRVQREPQFRVKFSVFHFPPGDKLPSQGPCVFVLDAPCLEDLTSPLSPLDTDLLLLLSFEDSICTQMPPEILNTQVLLLWFYLGGTIFIFILYNASSMEMCPVSQQLTEERLPWKHLTPALTVTASLEAYVHSNILRWDKCHSVVQLPELSSVFSCGSCRYLFQSPGHRLVLVCVGKTGPYSLHAGFEF